MRWTGYVARMGEKKTGYRILVERPQGKTPGIRRSWWVEIEINLKRYRMGLYWLD
jgi:hypothetical protein